MRELRCPDCRRANAIPGSADFEQVRCAACGSALRDGRAVRYEVEAPVLRGQPLVHHELVAAVARGAVRADTRVSEEGGPRFPAGERGDIFKRPPPRAPSPVSTRAMQPRTIASTSGGRRAPASVWIVVVMNYLLGLVSVLSALALAAAFGGSSVGWLLILPFLVSAIPFALAYNLRNGSSAARATQVVFSVLGALLVLGAAFSELDRLPVVLLLAFTLAPVGLLSTAPATEFFRSARTRP